MYIIVTENIHIYSGLKGVQSYLWIKQFVNNTVNFIKCLSIELSFNSIE